MKRFTLGTIIFAALLGVTAQAQIITNYGPGDFTNTNSGAYNPANDFPVLDWNGSWDGGSGKAISPNNFAAQTFIAPGVSGTVQLYAYNFQLNIQAPTIPNSNFHPAFTSAIYVWNPSGTGSGDNTSTGSLGAQLTPTLVVNPVIGEGFTIYGTNAVVAPGFGQTLNAGQFYALVIQRTDTPTGNLTGSVVQYGWDVGGTFSDGGLYTNTGSGYNRSGNAGVQDMAFWASFDAASLTPVPEPAVNGAIIGSLFVTGLLVWRRYGSKSTAQASTTF